MNTSETLFDRLGGRPRIRILLHHFYADVRQHRIIGPIFNDQIKNWPEHLEKIAEFWTRVTGGTSLYTGDMPGKHLSLGLRPEHFHAWLALWEANCRCYLPATEAQQMIDLAHAIAQRLQKILSGTESPFFATGRPLDITARRLG